LGLRYSGTMGMISEFAASELPKDYYANLLSEIKEINKKLNAFNVINEGISSGFPFSVKDNICVKGFEATAGSRMLKGYIPPFNATAVERLLAKDYGFVGKTAMDEFGFGSFGINTDRIARNPFDTDRVAGGSSSGAAVATAILKYHVAMCESTGGSIANPAANCGVVGFTPTYGVISRYGLIDYSNSLDKIGFMARKAEDIRTVLDVVRGPDKRDTTSVDRQITGVKKSRLYIIRGTLEKVDKEVALSFSKFIDKLGSEGYEIKEVSVEDIEKSIPAYYIISMAEASTNLAKYNGYKYGLKNDNFVEQYNDFFTEARANFGIEAKRRIILGTFVRSANVKGRYYYRALKIRAKIIERMSAILQDGFIISPTLPMKAPKLEEAQRLPPVKAYMSDFLNIPPNLGGFPHISFPFDYIDGMPIGAQIITSHFNDYALLDFASEWEKQFEYRFKYNLGSL